MISPRRSTSVSVLVRGSAICITEGRGSHLVTTTTLLRRSFDIDVLACPKCSGRLRVLGEVTEPAMVKLVLECVGLPTEAPRAARARDPTDLFAALDLN